MNRCYCISVKGGSDITCICYGIKRTHFIVLYSIRKPALPREGISMCMCA